MNGHLKGHNPYFSGNSFATVVWLIKEWLNCVTILILVETLLQLFLTSCPQLGKMVTILILVETLLQLNIIRLLTLTMTSHNPYFSGNSFATIFAVLEDMEDWVTILILVETLLQQKLPSMIRPILNVTILILVETLLQPQLVTLLTKLITSHNPYFSGNSFATFISPELALKIVQSQSLF